jgi:predicted ArsR family transcriptional regulator
MAADALTLVVRVRLLILEAGDTDVYRAAEALKVRREQAHNALGGLVRAGLAQRSGRRRRVPKALWGITGTPTTGVYKLTPKGLSMAQAERAASREAA